MSNKITVGIIGAAGCVAGVCIRALQNRSVDIVAGIDLCHIGEDIGTVAGAEAIGRAIVHADEGRKTLTEQKPDVVIDCSLNSIPEIYEHAKMCLENGINYMPVGVFCYDPFVTDPELAKELDEIGKKTGATYLGTGSAEVWQSLPMVVSALSDTVKKITIDFNALLNDFGAECLEGCEFGLEPEKWDTLVQEIYPSPFHAVLHMLADKAGLHVTDYRQENDYLGAKEEIHVDRLNVHIKKGCLCDYLSRDILTTEEGVVLVAQSHYKFGIAGETNSFEVTIEGEPNFHMVVEDFHGDVTTSTIMVNRIPDVVAAPGGIQFVNDLPVITYKTGKAFEK